MLIITRRCSGSPQAAPAERDRHAYINTVAMTVRCNDRNQKQLC